MKQLFGNGNSQVSATFLELIFSRTAPALMALPLIFGTPASAQNLQVNFGSRGIQTLSYRGVALEDLALYPSDAFHIWHMKATDLQGNVLSSGDYGWGENNSGSVWNASTNTESYAFSWGTIAVQFAQSGDNLNLIVTETNNAGSGIIFDGAELYPVTLHFPQDPLGFSGNTQYAITTLEPGVSAADFGSGVVTSVIPDEAVALYGGWKAAGANTYTPIMTATAPDALPSFLPHKDVPVAPGASFTYTVSLRFTAEGTAAAAADAYTSFAATYPSQMTWTDKRIIGTAYLASSPAGNGDITQPGGFPANPRRYFNDPSVDITTAAGLQAFQIRMLAQAQSNATNAQSLDAQGVITWDIEGEQYPQDTSYVCSPDQIATVAPEMESTIIDPASAFYGQKLDDAYFATLSSAGLRVGLCLRPQVFTQTPNGTASQVFLATNAAIVANVENKARYANSRWGATIFYVDSTVDINGGTLDPAIFQQLLTDLPSFLFIPEESTPRYYAYSAPFYSFLFHTDMGTPTSTYNFYPKAFGANLVNDVSASTLNTYQGQLTQAVSKGDILMGHADYWQENDPTLVAIYRNAGVSAPNPVRVSPVIFWAGPAAISYGAALSTSQLNATASVPGSFAYSPSAGSVLNAGSNSLTVTFTPADTASYKAATASVNLTVTPAAPVISWSAPGSIAYGAPLRETELDATANVPGRFTYTPARGAKLPAGMNTLQVTFTPKDSTDYSTQSASTSLLVTGVDPRIRFSVADQHMENPSFTLAARSNSPGAFTYSVVSGPATISGSEVTVSGAGDVVLQVTQAASGEFAAGTRLAQFSVLSAPLKKS